MIPRRSPPGPPPLSAATGRSAPGEPGAFDATLQPGPFWAKVTGQAAGTNRYAWTQVDEGDTAAFDTGLSAGFAAAGTSAADGGCAYEVNGRQDVPTGTRVRLWPGGDFTYYTFSHTAGSPWKEPVRAATTGDITLSGAQTIDGVSVVAGDRVLVKDQSAASANGIYVAAAGSWTRATDADSGAKLLGACVAVCEGAANADTVWLSTANAPITLGVTALPWRRIDDAKLVVQEVDGAPSYAAVTTLEFDQDDGFVVSQPAAGVARVDLDRSVSSTVTIDRVQSASVASTDTPQEAVQLTAVKRKFYFDLNAAGMVVGVREDAGTVSSATNALFGDTNVTSWSFDSGTGELLVAINAVWSVVGDVDGLHLKNDLSAPGATKYYGTNGGGTKGWYSFPTSGTVTSVAATAPTAGFTISGSPITAGGTFVFALANDLAAVEGLSGAGLATRTATDTWTVRTVTGTSNKIDVTDGDGVAGNPTLTISPTYAGGTSIVTVGTLTAGATGAGFTLALSTSTVTGTLPAANLPTSTPAWTKVTKTFTQLKAGAVGTGNDIEIYSLAAGEVLHSVRMAPTTGLSGPGITNVTISVGVAASHANFIAADVVTVAAGVFFMDDGNHTNNVGGGSALPRTYSMTAATSIRAYIVSTGANLSALTAGSVDFEVLTSTPP